jgi:uracil-DNA glycosylase
MLINNNWNSILEQEFKKEYFKNLISFIDKEYEKDEIFPSKNEIFNAFKLTDYENVKVVILGQDPYHGYDEAEGLSFSVKNHIKRPPSLRNIFKEIKNCRTLQIHSSAVFYCLYCII